MPCTCRFVQRVQVSDPAPDGFMAPARSHAPCRCPDQAGLVYGAATKNTNGPCWPGVWRGHRGHGCFDLWHPPAHSPSHALRGEGAAVTSCTYALRS
eukprot:scaffold37476_cov20-Tisochrysis_lutea.AAC.2